MSDFSPRLEILPPAQRRLRVEVGETAPGFILYDRTGVPCTWGIDFPSTSISLRPGFLIPPNSHAVDLDRLTDLSDEAVRQASQAHNAMKRLELTNEFSRAARRCMWFESPEPAISNPAHFAAYADLWDA